MYLFRDHVVEIVAVKLGRSKLEDTIVVLAARAAKGIKFP